MADEHPAQLSGSDSPATIEDIGSAAQALCSIVASFIADDSCEPDFQQLDALYTNLEPCRLVLARHGDLYAALKEGLVTKTFDAVRNHAALRQQTSSASVAQLLSDLLPSMIKCIEEGGLKAWSLATGITAADDVRGHIASLEMPSVGGAPSMLLRDLGRFSEDAKLANRVNNIFSQGQHTFLVNTSGSGKTRLTFEGLCQNWGFYFVGAVDSNGIGSGDLNYLLEAHIARETNSFHEFALPPVSSQNVSENIQITHRCLRRLLLCRLLVFSMFADHVHAVGVTAEHKKLWLLLQALPLTMIPRHDIFYVLLMEMANTEDNFVQDYIAHLITKLRDLFGDGFHMFFVVDEAQAVFRHHGTAFREADGTYYPILREILDGWDGEFPTRKVSFVTAGTQIPKAGFQNSQNSDRHRWCSDTGAFDDERVHREYISSFLPPSYVNTLAAKAFLNAVSDWCHGRYRLTDTLLATLARDGFRSPHTLLNDYVEVATGYRPQNNLEFVETENGERAEIRIPKVDCKVLEYPALRLSATTLRDVLVHYSATGKHPPPFSVDHIQLIDRAFGRFIDDQMSQIVIDEPVMLVAVAQWFCNSAAHSPEDSFWDIIQLYPPTSSLTLLCALVIHIAHAFSQGHLVYKVFSFPHSAAPAWAKQKAEVVALHRLTDGQIAHKAADSSAGFLAMVSDSLEDTISWLAPQDDAILPPFCLPRSGNPDLICVLRLADGRFARVVLNASTTTTILRDSPLRQIIKGLDDENIFPFEDPELRERAVSSLHSLPQNSSRGLRVIASFPAQVHLKTATNKSTRGVAGLNNNLFKTVAAATPTSTVLEMMVDAVFGQPRHKRRRTASTEEPESKRLKVSPATRIPKRKS
ncbi:hypothetical protein C8R47DRAFT_1224722 [Mycena vitilis]|nr:hypothetical protein C8R47DRAFT_1224722 [Mycena vitilis]